jgi:uncharacterized protein (TIGR00304 family)
MKKLHILSFISVIISIIFFIFGFFEKEIEFGIIFFFPYISGTGIYAFIGFVFIFIAIILFMFGFTLNNSSNNDIKRGEIKYEKKTSCQGGGVVLIGPIPIVFGSNWKITLVLMICAITLMLLLLFVFNFFMN